MHLWIEKIIAFGKQTDGGMRLAKFWVAEFACLCCSLRAFLCFAPWQNSFSGTATNASGAEPQDCLKVYFTSHPGMTSVHALCETWKLKLRTCFLGGATVAQG